MAQNIRAVGFAKGTLNTRKDVDKFIDLIKQALTELSVPFADDCCGVVPPVGGPGSGNSIFFGASNCISSSGAGTEENPTIFEPIISGAAGNALSCTENGLYVPESDTEITNIENIINNFIQDTFDGTYLIDGGQITWLQNYNYTASAANYLILGEQVHSNQTNFTLGAADPTNDRIDLVVVNSAGNVVVIPGTPAANPAEPSYDPETQIPLAFITVTAGTTAPPCAATSPVYTDNLGVGGGEFTAVSSSGTINVNSSSNPRTGTKDIEATNVATNATITFSPAAPVDFTNVTQLNFYIRSKGTWAGGGNKRINVSLRNSFGQVGNALTIQPTATFGFNSATVGSYQKISMPVLAFNIPAGSLITSIQFRVTGAKIGVGFYIDDFNLENNCNIVVGGGNLVNVTADNGLSPHPTPGVNTIELGGPLIKNTNINAGQFPLTILGANTTGRTVSVTNTGGLTTSVAFFAQASLAGVAGDFISATGIGGRFSGGQYGIFATSTVANGVGIRGEASSGASSYGVIGFANTGTPLQGLFSSTDQSSVFTTLELNRSVDSGGGLAGVGNKIKFITQTTVAGQISNEIISKWTTATSASRVSEFSITGVNNAVTSTIMRMDGTGNVIFYGDNVSVSASSGVQGGNFTGTSVGILGTSNSIPIWSINNSTSTNTIVQAISISRSNANAAVGLGSSINTSLGNSVASSKLASRLITKWLIPTALSEVSQFDLELLNVSVNNVVLSITGTGIITTPLGLQNFANDAAAAVGGIPVNGWYRNGSVQMIRVV